MDNYNGPQGESIVDDLSMNNDIDTMDDLQEEEHHRRSYHHDEERRDRSPERREDSHRAAHDRDDKYDRRPSNGAGHQDRASYRSRSRSPMRGVSGGGSLRDKRVYIGNLSYDVRWTHLKDFMREIGPVAHADVLMGHDGRSKGCGVVEYQNAEDAKTAIRKLNDVVFMGRPVFVREDRESESRIGTSGRGNAAPVPRRDSGPANGNSGRQIFVANLPYSVNWKDLKDLFRKAGPVSRADIFMDRDNRSRGSATVSFEGTQDVGRAISMFNGYEWHGRRIEVREDKFGPPAGGARNSGPPPPTRYDPPSSSHGGSSYRGGDDIGRGNSHNDSYGYGHNNSSGGHRDHRDDRRNDLPHHGHDMYDGSARRTFVDDVNMAAIPSGPAAGAGDQIYIRNLPFTTTEQDLRDLFRTCGPIKMTEILEQGGRPKGSGIVRFDMFESADKAVAKFNGYVYGGRSLEVMYDRV